MPEQQRNAAPKPARRLLCLAGFMGSGKTTVGQILAQRLGWHFVDLDARIVEEAGMSIRAIFDGRGEPAFRALEHELLVRILGGAVATGRPTVLALGGGTLAQPASRELVRSSGAITVWLDCPVQEILGRCAGITDRPLFTDEDGVRRLYDKRRPSYEQADFRVESVDAPERVAERILALGILERVKV
jgi:shikimate kinase